jgi:peptide/nickel transport system substrate-binding protein
VRACALILVVLGVAATTASAPAAEKRGGTLVIASREQACLNLLLETCRTGGLALYPAIKQVLGGAFEVSGALAYRPNLVAGAEVTRRKPFTVTYRIRPEAVWSDGRPVSSRDFEFTWKVAREREALGAEHAKIRKVVVLGPKTVRAVFEEPVPDFREFFGIVLPRHALAGENLDQVWLEAIDNPKTGVAIGNGPFLVRRWEEDRLTLVRNPRYWGPHLAYLDRLVFRFLPEAEHADALRRGDVDLVPGGTAAAKAAVLELRRQRPPGVRVESGPGVALEHLELRIGPGGHPALKSRLVRKALAFGLDRKAIARAVLGRLWGVPAAGVQVLDSAVFTGRSPYYRPNWADYRQRRAEALRLLGKAGCRVGEDGIYVCRGERLSLRFFTTAGVESRKLTLDLMRSQLRAIGVEVEEQYVAPNLFFNGVLPGGSFDAALFSWELDPALWAPYYTFACGTDQNYTGYCRRTLSSDLRRSTSMLDFRRRVQALNRIDARLAEDVPVIPLFQPPVLVAVDAKVRGVDASSVSSAFFDWGAQDWWLAR